MNSQGAADIGEAVSTNRPAGTAAPPHPRWVDPPPAEKGTIRQGGVAKQGKLVWGQGRGLCALENFWPRHQAYVA